MKILLTLPGPLFPADTGGKIRSLNIFSRLAKRAEIHAVSFADPAGDTQAISEMKAMFASYTPVFRREAKKYSPRFYAEILANQLGALPYFLAKCDRADFRRAVENLICHTRFDLLFCDFLHTAVPLLEFSFKPRMIFEHNVEYLLRKRKWEVEKHPLRKWIFGAEWRKTKAIEAKVCRAFDHILAVSEDDQRTFRNQFALSHVSTIPTGVDTDFFRPAGERPKPGHLVFVGSMDWDPNEDGAIWFLREVYSQIKQAVPNLTLSIVGRGPSSRLRAIAAEKPGVEITGRVDDVRPYLSQAEIVVVPLRIGGGTRIKIPEAMAMAKPVVSTPIGAEGLPFRDGREIRIAERPEEFAQAVIKLLGDASLMRSIGEAARQEVVGKYGWDMVVARVEEILEQVTCSGRRTSAA